MGAILHEDGEVYVVSLTHLMIKTNMSLHIIGLVVFLVGMLLPIKEFSAKAAAPQEA